MRKVLNDGLGQKSPLVGDAQSLPEPLCNLSLLTDEDDLLVLLVPRQFDDNLGHTRLPMYGFQS